MQIPNGLVIVILVIGYYSGFVIWDLEFSHFALAWYLSFSL